MGVCAMGLSAEGYQVAYRGNLVYLLHSTLTNASAELLQSDTEAVARLVKFVEQQKQAN